MSPGRVATILESPAAPDAAHRTGLSFFVHVQSIVERSRKLLAFPVEQVEEPYLTFPARVRKFLWLSSGLFSAASLVIPAIGYLAFGSVEGNATNFLVAVVSACVFGVASLLHFGPDSA